MGEKIKVLRSKDIGEGQPILDFLAGVCGDNKVIRLICDTKHSAEKRGVLEHRQDFVRLPVAINHDDKGRVVSMIGLIGSTDEPIYHKIGSRDGFIADIIYGIEGMGDMLRIEVVEYNGPNYKPHSIIYSWRTRQDILTEIEDIELRLGSRDIANPSDKRRFKGRFLKGKSKRTTDRWQSLMDKLQSLKTNLTGNGEELDLIPVCFDSELLLIGDQSSMMSNGMRKHLLWDPWFATPLEERVATEFNDQKPEGLKHQLSKSIKAFSGGVKKNNPLFIRIWEQGDPVGGMTKEQIEASF